MPWVKAALLSDLPEGGALGVTAGVTRVALAAVDGEVYAFGDNCTHRDFPLSLGQVDAASCTVTCEWHGAAFCLRTGAPTLPPAVRPVPVYPARIEDGAVWVDVA